MEVSIRMKCVVYKNVMCEGDSLEDILDSPWDYAVDEHETDQVDWDVVSYEIEAQ